MPDRPSFELNCDVNGESVSLNVGHHELLIDVLRDQLGLTATKRSCDVQICGACSVLLDGAPVSSCCTLAWEARERSILTVEGLADENGLHRLQSAFAEHFALQCGYCIPGMLMMAKHLLDSVPSPTKHEIREHLNGNICRCGAHLSIISALQTVVGSKDDNE